MNGGDFTQLGKGFYLELESGFAPWNIVLYVFRGCFMRQGYHKLGFYENIKIVQTPLP